MSPNVVPSRRAFQRAIPCGGVPRGADTDAGPGPTVPGPTVPCPRRGERVGPAGCRAVRQIRWTVCSFVAYVPVPSRVEEPARSDMVGPLPVLRLERKRRLPFVSLPR